MIDHGDPATAIRESYTEGYERGKADQEGNVRKMHSDMVDALHELGRVRSVAADAVKELRKVVAHPTTLQGAAVRFLKAQAARLEAATGDAPSELVPLAEADLLGEALGVISRAEQECRHVFHGVADGRISASGTSSLKGVADNLNAVLAKSGADHV